VSDHVGINWSVGSVGSTIVESDEQVLVRMPDDGHMALYEVCCYLFFANRLTSRFSQHLMISIMCLVVIY